MPRSSRHKSHKQHKHSSKEAREYSDSEEIGSSKDRKEREKEKEKEKEEVSVVREVRVSRDSSSSEKRKLDKDVVFNTEEYSASKRRKERSETDRWNGGDVVVVGGGTKIENSSEKGLKSKVLVDSKSSGNKSSRRHESLSEKKEANSNSVLVGEVEEVKRSGSSSKLESSKSKSEKESSRKEAHQSRDLKDSKDSKDLKEKEHLVERTSKVQDVRRERSVDRVAVKGGDTDGNKKQSSHFEERSTKQEIGNTELPVQGDLRNPELEKELEKRTRRKRDGSDDKDRYPDDGRDTNGRRLSTKDERHKDDRHKDKYREDMDRDHRNRDDRVRVERSSKDERARDERSSKDDRVRDERSSKDDRVRDERSSKDDRARNERSLKDDRARDERSPKDRASDRSDARHSRDEHKSAIENRNKKSKTENSDRDGSPHLHDDRAARYKDYRGKKRSPDDEDRNDLKARHTKEQRYEVERKASSGKMESMADRGRSQLRFTDGDSTVSASRRKSSPSSGAHFPKDNFRHTSTQAELKYKDNISEERVRGNLNPSRELSSVSGVPERPESRSADKPRSIGKPIHKDKNHLVDQTSERSPVSDAQVSPLQLKEKSHSSTSIDRRHSNRTPARRNIDVDESGHRSGGSKDLRDYPANEDRGSQDWPLEKPGADEFSQAEADTVSVSSSFNRNSHLATSSSSALPPPPPLRSGVDSPSVFNSFDEDSRGKPSTRYKRSGDPNVGRGQGNAWKGVPNWSTPVPNGFIPFQQGHPPGGFVPMMQQFHGPPLYGVRPSIELNPTGVPYHIPDPDRYSNHGRSFGWRNRVDDACPPHMHGWDGNNGAFGDEAHMHGKPDWDQNRHMMNDRSWETSLELWKGPVDFLSASRKEDNQPRAPVDEVWAGKNGPRSRNDRSRSVSRAESIEIKISDDISSELVPIEAPKQVIVEETPEPPKSLSNNGLCHVYLSKLDISVDLTHPELYKQCRSLLDMERNIANSDPKEDISTKEGGKAGMKIANTSSSVPFFSKIKDSVLERAMTLYKKQREEMKAKFPIPSLFQIGAKSTPTKDGEKLHPDAIVNGQNEGPAPVLNEEKKELTPTSVEEGVADLVAAFGIVKEDVGITATNSEKMEDTVQTSGQEIPVELLADQEKNYDETAPNSCDETAPNSCDETAPNSCNDMVEPVPLLSSQDQEPVPLLSSQDQEPVPLIDPEDKVQAEEVEADADAKGDSITSIMEDVKLAEEPSTEQALQLTVESTKLVDDIMACEEKGSYSPSNLEGKNAYTDDTMCGNIGVTDGPEACVALTPMSIECKSVNLSRIPYSPESTH